MYKKEMKMAFVFLLAVAVNLCLVSAVANFQVSSFSCSPTESAVNAVFSCTAQIQNVGDATGSVSTATLYPDAGDWLEDSNYPQASGTSVDAGQSTEVTFTGLRAIKSGSNGFSKIMLDTVTDNYVSDNDVEVNIIDVAVSVNSTETSRAMGASFDTTAEVTAGGSIDVTLTFAVLSGGCSIGSQESQKAINDMSDGNKQSRTWTVTQGTSGDCVYRLTASATGEDGIATDSDSVTTEIDCSDCPVESSSPGGGAGGGGGGGGGGMALSLGELTSTVTKELYPGWKAEFNISGTKYSLTFVNMTLTGATAKLSTQNESVDFVLNERREFDFNEDGTADVAITLIDMNIIMGSVTFKFERLSSVLEESSGAGSGEEISDGGAGAKIGEFVEKNKTSLIVIFAIIIIGVVVFVLIGKGVHRKLFPESKYAKKIWIKEGKIR